MEHLLSTRARRSTSSAIRDLLRLTAEPHILSLAGGLPAPELFPVAALRRITDDLLASPCAARDVLQYGPTEGTDELRALLAPSSVGGRRREVLVTTGSQQALDLLARVLVDPEDVVVVESPSYLGALQVLQGQGSNIVPVDADGDGLDTAHLGDLLARGMRPKLCYTVANFSNPSGATMSRERRIHLATLADRYGFVIVEDDPYGALRFTGTRVESIGRFGANVVTLGSASKTLAPGLRVGWAVVPPWLMAPLVRQKQAADLHTSSLAQAIVARSMQADWYESHVRAIGVAYSERATALFTALGEHDVFSTATRPEGGMFGWVRLRNGADTAALLPDALARGVAYVPGSAFSSQARYRDHVRLSFATLEPARLREAVARLAQVARGVTRQAAFA